MGWWLLAAIAASIVSSQIVGMLWYGPLFGNLWMKEMGWEKLSKKQVDEKMKDAMPGYIISAIAGGVATSVLWLMLVTWDFHNLAMSDLHAIPAGILLGGLAWVVGYVPGTISSRFFEDKTWMHWGIGAGYWAIMALLWGLFVGAFSLL